MLGQLRSHAFVALAALIWVAGSLFVAFPDTALALNYEHMISTFIVNPSHSISVLLLWFIDVGITVALLRDGRIRDGVKRRLGSSIASLFGFVVLAWAVPLQAPNFMANHSFGMGVAALGCLLVFRWITYAAPAGTARPV